MARIIVIGGGIAGLSAAYDLHREGRHQVTLLEATDRLGGKIVTHYSEQLIIEGGPDSVFTTKPWAVDLMEELGLGDELVEPIGGGFSLFVGGKLHTVPRALASLIPSASTALESIGFLGAAARKRIRSEGEIPKGTGDDESIASFFRRRFGSHFSKSLAEPLLAGIHAGDAEKLSMKALYPTYIGLEQKNGKLTMEGHPPAPGAHNHGTRKPGFITLRGGLQRFVDVLEQQLQGADIRKGFRVDQLAISSTGTVIVSGTETLEADYVVLAIPAAASAKYLSGVAPEATNLLNRIRQASTAVVTLAVPLANIPKGLHDNGFLVPADEKIDITGCTYTSTKWPGRAPEDTALIRMFMGRDGGMDVRQHTDEQLSNMAFETLRKVLHVQGSPTYSQVDRWEDAMPQYALGHTDLMDGVEKELANLPILLAGGSYRGTGIPDCIRQGRQAAQTIQERLSVPA